MKVRGTLLLFALFIAAAPARADEIPLFGAKLTRLGGTFEQPLGLAVREGDSRIFIAEKPGRVKTLDGAVILDLAAEADDQGEGGLLGLAFSPGGAYMYVTFTDRTANHRIHVTAFAVPGGVVDLASRREILVVDHPGWANHYGGGIAFGPDGYLYVALGDGGGGGDPDNNGQNRNALLGKMLRIAPDPTPPEPPYSIPPGNPFIGLPNTRPEIWSYGLRNPWRFSFDKGNGDLWIGDVGQNMWEEVDYRPRGSTPGENFGWNRMEGNHPYNGGTAPPDHVPPVYEYVHQPGGACSVTGGYVYRGSALPAALHGRYLFADFCGGRVKVLVDIAGISLPIDLNLAAPFITSFGQDAAGELYVMTYYEGGVYRIDPF